MVVVRGDKRNQKTKQLRLDVLGDIVPNLIKGGDHVWSTIRPKKSNPQRRGRGTVLQLLVPCVIEVGSGVLRLVRLGEAPEVVLGEEDLVSMPHKGSHPIECQSREDSGVFDRAFFLLLNRLISITSQIARPEPLDEERGRREAEAHAVDSEIWHVLGVELLGDEGSELDGGSDNKEQPVEEGNAMGVSNPRMLQPLDRKDGKQRCDGQNSRPNAEVANRYRSKVDYLYDKLYGDIGDNGGNQGL